MLFFINPTTLISILGFGLGILILGVIGLLIADDFVAKRNKKKGK